MARSYRKPFGYWCYGNPSKDKQRGRRRLRRLSSQVLREMGDPDNNIYPLRDEVDNPWNWGVDGKAHYVGNTQNEAYRKKVTRK